MENNLRIRRPHEMILNLLRKRGKPTEQAQSDQDSMRSMQNFEDAVRARIKRDVEEMNQRIERSEQRVRRLVTVSAIVTSVLILAMLGLLWWFQKSSSTTLAFIEKARSNVQDLQSELETSRKDLDRAVKNANDAITLSARTIDTLKAGADDAQKTLDKTLADNLTKITEAVAQAERDAKSIEVATQSVRDQVDSVTADKLWYENAKTAITSDREKLNRIAAELVKLGTALRDSNRNNATAAINAIQNALNSKQP
jgi:archaellum component FlaC